MKLPQKLSALSHIPKLAFMSAFFVVYLLSHAAPPSCSVTPICLWNIRNIEKRKESYWNVVFRTSWLVPQSAAAWINLSEHMTHSVPQSAAACISLSEHMTHSVPQSAAACINLSEHMTHSIPQSAAACISLPEHMTHSVPQSAAACINLSEHMTHSVPHSAAACINLSEHMTHSCGKFFYSKLSVSLAWLRQWS
jgi:hypothetical protein